MWPASHHNWQNISALVPSIPAHCVNGRALPEIPNTPLLPFGLPLLTTGEIGCSLRITKAKPIAPITREKITNPKDDWGGNSEVRQLQVQAQGLDIGVGTSTKKSLKIQPPAKHTMPVNSWASIAHEEHPLRLERRYYGHPLYSHH